MVQLCELMTFVPPDCDADAVMPGAALLNLNAHTPLEVAAALRQGLPVGPVMDALKTASGKTEVEIAHYLGLSPATLHRRRKSPRKRFLPDESERAYRLARLLERAAEVLGSADEAREWMREPLLAMGNKTVFEAAQSEIGAELVMQLLGRLQDGVYS